MVKNFLGKKIKKLSSSCFLPLFWTLDLLLRKHLSLLRRKLCEHTRLLLFFASANNMGKWGFMDDNDGRFIGKVWRLRCKLHDYIVVHLSPIQSWSLRDFATLDTRVTITNGTWFLSLSMKDDGFSRMRVCNRSSRTIINHIRRTTELRRNFLYLFAQCIKKSW